MEIQEMKRIRHILRYACLMLCVGLGVCLTACCDEAHEGEYPLSERQGAVIVGLESSVPVTDLTLYLFGSDGTVFLRKTYGGAS